jgi:predicted methyltransferase
MPRWLKGVAAVALLLAAPAFAQTRDSAALTKLLTDPSRPERQRAADAGRKPAEVLELLRLQPGQRVLDMSAGRGYYTRLLAPAVGPSGRVFAHSTEGLIAVDGLQPDWEAIRASWPNVELRLGIPGNMRLPQKLDRVLFHLAFHDLWWEDATYRIPRMEAQKFLKQLHKAVKHGGLVLVVDHAANPGGDPRAETLARHRVDPAVVRAEMQSAGFALEAQSALLANPADDHTKLVYDPAIRGKTDRFILLFRRP